MRLRAFFARFTVLDGVIFALVLLFLIPIWGFVYIPTQDGPSHLNNAQILSQFTNPAFHFQQIYNLRLSLFPNWLSHAGLAALMWIFPPLLAEKLLLSLYVVGFPLAFLYFLGALDPAKKPYGLLSFAFIYNYLFMMGFWNFIFSIPLMFLTLGYFWKRRARPGWRAVLVLNLLLLLVYFGHMITYLVALGSVALIAAAHFVHQAFIQREDSLRKQAAALAVSLVSLLPTLPLLVNYYLGSSFAGKTPHIDLKRVPDLLGDLFSMRILTSFDVFHQGDISAGVSAALGLLVLVSIIRRLASPRGTPRRGLRFEDTILVLVFILMGLYLVMPWDFGTGGWLNDRLALLGSLFLLAWVDLPPGRTASAALSRGQSILRKSLLGISVLASLAVLGGVTYAFIRLEPLLREYVTGTAYILPNSVMLPMNFMPRGELYDRTDPLLHANHYQTLTNGAVNLGNYETFVDYFPLEFKTGLDLPVYRTGKNWNDALEEHDHSIGLCSYVTMVDTLLIWDTPDPYFQSAISRCYSLVFSQGRQKVYVPRK